jgi:hypothetical protein
MPRFYFHIQTVDGENEEDTVGAEFSTEEEAIAEAQALAHELMLDAAKAAHDVKQLVEVTNESGDMIVHLDCSSAIKVTVGSKSVEGQKR